MSDEKSYSPGLEGVVAGISSISEVDPEKSRLTYRGYDVHELAEKATYEEVAHLLLMGKLPNRKELSEFSGFIGHERHIPGDLMDMIQMYPDKAHPMDVLRSAVSALGLYDSTTPDLSRNATLEKSMKLIAKIPTIIAASHRFREDLDAVDPDPKMTCAESFLYLLTGKRPDPLAVRALDVSLVLYAEHSFNASTFSARVTASTLSDYYSSVVSAIGTLKGPLHGGANEEAIKMMLEIGSPAKAEAWVMDALAKKRLIMGFGHRVYKKGDSRVPIMRKLGQELAEKLGQPQWHQMAQIVEEVMWREKKIPPNVDFPCGYVYYMLKLPIPLYTPIFAASRVAGWSAHIIEQYERNRIMRPTNIYNGPKEAAFAPLEQRM
ncbi:MAG: citrate synthase [Candidatus Handelsmanbacteria bacterium RIFCSPLOWO2_12_FULL_64_10]|uniref:Citrate synthase n=1 Tax=Handelsmanbacteria sp. (strain RIFCSPLOWO2_12_FULL_64_10) TaxID=1817868 RepID=A0A1F6CQC3_HANXR|nr:MAG: citrate synthase [Candidatus Handelsmanbacteria bacterium RIFCSPLOWO2_12_FULL_64_10]